MVSPHSWCLINHRFCLNTWPRSCSVRIVQNTKKKACHDNAKRRAAFHGFDSCRVWPIQKRFWLQCTGMVCWFDQILGYIHEVDLRHYLAKVPLDTYSNLCALVHFLLDSCWILLRDMPLIFLALCDKQPCHVARHCTLGTSHLSDWLFSPNTRHLPKKRILWDTCLSQAIPNFW